MMQSRTHTCGQLRLSDAGKQVTIVGWLENVREVGANFAFCVLRDYYGTTQVVIENEEMMKCIKPINKESTLSVTGIVRERESKNTKIPTGEIEVVPEKIEVLGKCRHNQLPFEINKSRDADENTRIGYSKESGKSFARPFVKYTPTWPRSFMPANQKVRNQVAKMKQIPVPELIEGKKLLFVDDSIVRGTQLRETVEFLYRSHAAEVHMRSACPPIMYSCKYLNFSSNGSDMDLLARL